MTRFCQLIAYRQSFSHTVLMRSRKADAWLVSWSAHPASSIARWSVMALLVGSSATAAAAVSPLPETTAYSSETSSSGDQGKPTTYEPTAPTEEKRGSKGPGLGVYGDILAMWMIGTSTSHEWTENCPSFASNAPQGSWTPQCDTKAPMGFLLEGRLGLRFGYVGVEGIGVAAGDWSTAKLDEEPPGVPALGATMHVGRIGGGLGGGLRFLTKPGIFRFTTGVGGGVMFRHVYSSVSSLDGTSEGYRAPFVRVDANLVLLSFLSVGFQAYFEFAPSVVLQPNIGEVFQGGQEVDDVLGQIRVFRGPQIFIGPVVGIHFGG